jgi:hypothetical protein
MKSEEEVREEIRFQEKQRKTSLGQVWCSGEFDPIIIDIDARISMLKWVLDELV